MPETTRFHQSALAVGQRVAGETFAPLATRTFALLWTATMVSNCGTLIQNVGAAWMMTTLTASPTMTALVHSVNTLPMVMFSLLAGALADIFDRRALMIFAQSAMILASTALAVLTYLDAVTPIMLLELTFIIGTGAAINGPTWHASIGDIVQREALPSAVALNAMSFNAARTVGPAIGGMIVASIGAAAAFMANVVATLPLLGALIIWRRSPPMRSVPSERLVEAMWAGVRYVSLSPPILESVLRGGLFGLCGSAIWSLLAVIARAQLDGSAALFGLMLSAMGIGALFGTVPSASLRRKLGPEGVWTVCASLYALATIIIGISHSLLITALALFIAGACWMLAFSTLMARVQLSSPRWVVGRTVAVYQFCSFGAVAVGSAIWGALAGIFDLALSLGVAGSVLLAFTLLLRLRPMQPELADVVAAPLSEVEPPTLDVDDASQPIVVTRHYSVCEQDRDRFLALMRQTSRVRRRDGVLGWELVQDIDEPDLWIERFHSSNWTEHRRRRTRAVTSDQVLRDALAEFVVKSGAQTRRYVRRLP